MMICIKQAFLAAALFAVTSLVGTAVCAQGWMGRMDTDFLYLGAGAAKTKNRVYCSDTDVSGYANCDNKDSGWKATAGYQFFPNVAVELGYVRLGKFGATTAAAPGFASYKARAIEILAVVTVPLFIDDLSGFMKVGVAGWKASATAVTLPVGVPNRKASSDMTFGLGLSYDITRQIAARVEWQRYPEIEIDTFGAAVLYKFR
jgi:OOP family OmpA-OmpF porin